MSKVDNLIADGTVLEYTEDTSKVIFNVPLLIPKEVIENGGFELFASAYGWEPEVTDPLDATKKIPNPITVFKACIDVVRNFAWEVLSAQLIKHAEHLARTQAQTQINIYKGTI